MSSPRGVQARIQWMLDHPPGSPGWCAREVWHALGGDQDPPNPPAWGTDDANEVYDRVKASGRWFDTWLAPDGADIIWKYGKYGHTALATGGRICTTDPEGKPGGVGIEDLDYPHRWGANSTDRIWTDEYNGVRFAVGADQPEDEDDEMGVFRSLSGAVARIIINDPDDPGHDENGGAIEWTDPNGGTTYSMPCGDNSVVITATGEAEFDSSPLWIGISVWESRDGKMVKVKSLGPVDNQSDRGASRYGTVAIGTVGPGQYLRMEYKARPGTSCSVVAGSGSLSVMAVRRA